MPALSYVTMRNRVALNIGNMQSSDPFFANLGAYVNDALNKLILRALGSVNRNIDLFPELRKKWTSLTTVDQATVSLPADCLAVQLIYSLDSSASPNLNNADRKPMTWLADADYELLPKAINVTGYPRLYAVEGSLVYVHPTPRTGYTTYILIKGIQQETELSADGDVPVMDKRWHSAVVDYASYLVCIDKGWTEDASRFLTSCDQKVSNCASLLALRQTKAPFVVDTDFDLRAA